MELGIVNVGGGGRKFGGKLSEREGSGRSDVVSTVFVVSGEGDN